MIAQSQTALDLSEGMSPNEKFRLRNKIASQKSRFYNRICSMIINQDLFDCLKRNARELLEIIACVLDTSEAKQFCQLFLSKITDGSEAVCNDTPQKQQMIESASSVEGMNRVARLENMQDRLVSTMEAFAWGAARKHMGRPGRPIVGYLEESYRKIDLWKQEIKQNRHNYEKINKLHNKISAQRARIVFKKSTELDSRVQRISKFLSNFKRLGKILSQIDRDNGNATRETILIKLGATETLKMHRIVVQKQRKHPYWFCIELEKFVW